MKKKQLTKLDNDIQKVLSRYKDLKVIYSNNEPIEINGTLKILDNNSVLQGEYDIKLLIPKRYPYAFPVLFETSNKIERIADRHIDKQGEACLEITHKQRIVASRGITLCSFFENYVIPYFCWQLIYDEEGSENLKEWGHNELGVAEYYIELIKTNDLVVIKKLIKAAMIGNIPALNDKCVCGSDKIFKRCHNEILQNIRWFGVKQLTKDILVIEHLLANQH